jgi:hypothetical protein
MIKPSLTKPVTLDPPGFPWLGLLLIVSIIMLFFQVFPGTWWGLTGVLGTAWWALMGLLGTAWWTFLAIVDVRNWTWKVYASLCAIAIFGLVGAKAWLER